MDLELKNDDKVKEISIGNGCIQIDLLSGLRLSGPLLSNDEVARTSARPRRMMVSGHEAISSQMAFV
ncbi:MULTISPECIES: hypothetical protein [Massilia]|jgi:hypothetical protein|uniref:hypothetical protein n=1 Tax=Massilia TaxID=149698 RepID=UPI000409D0F2|nr:MULTISPECIES: hypothetical protein [Massilia]KFC73545.1 hypothetical protein FG94_01323 [Massilia sp. LC238]